MPWTPDDARAKNKSITSAAQAKRWASIANNVRSKCISDGGSESVCDGKAIRIANGVLKAKKSMENGSGLMNFDKDESRVGFYVDEVEVSPLAHLESDKPEFEKWEKLLIREGTVTHPTQGFTLDVTRDRMKQWVENHSKIKQHGGVFVPLRHSRNPKDNTGWVESLSVRDGKDGKAELWGLLDIADAEINKKLHDGTIRDVSVCIDPDVRVPDASGNGEVLSLGEGVEHVAWTMLPAAPQKSIPVHVGLDRAGRETQYWALSRDGGTTPLQFQKQTVGKEPPAAVVLGSGKVAKDAAKYRLGDTSYRCGLCMFYRSDYSMRENGEGDGTCTVVDGPVLADRLSDYFRPRASMFDAELLQDEEETDGEGAIETEEIKEKTEGETTEATEGEELVLSSEYDDATTKKKRKIKKKAGEVPPKEMALDPNAAVRNRPGAILPATHVKVKDKKSHFPIPDEAHGRNALARVNQFASVPSWFSGTLAELKSIIIGAVQRKFPGIKVSEKSKMSLEESEMDLQALAEKLGFEDTLSDDPVEAAEQLKGHFAVTAKPVEPPAPIAVKTTPEYKALEAKNLELQSKLENNDSRIKSLEAEHERRRQLSIKETRRQQFERIQKAVDSGRIDNKMAKAMAGSYKFEFEAEVALDSQESAIKAFEDKLGVIELLKPASAWPGIHTEITRSHLLESLTPDEEEEKTSAAEAEKTKKVEAERESEMATLFESIGATKNYAPKVLASNRMG